MPEPVLAVEAFAALHHRGQAFLLPNAWDVASALVLADAAFPAIGTTSLGVTAAAGLPDGAGAGRDLTVALAAALVPRLTVPLTVDLEGGYSDDPAPAGVRRRRRVRCVRTRAERPCDDRHPCTRGRAATQRPVAARRRACAPLRRRCRPRQHRLGALPARHRRRASSSHRRPYGRAATGLPPGLRRRPGAAAQGRAAGPVSPRTVVRPPTLSGWTSS